MSWTPFLHYAPVASRSALVAGPQQSAVTAQGQPAVQSSGYTQQPTQPTSALYQHSDVKMRPIVPMPGTAPAVTTPVLPFTSNPTPPIANNQASAVTSLPPSVAPLIPGTV